MTPIKRKIVLTAVAGCVANVVFAAPASATDYQLDTACDSDGMYLCVHAVHNGHFVKSIGISTLDGLPGTLHISWGDFHRTSENATQHQWNLEDKQGRARGDSVPIRRSDVVCGSLERLGISLAKNVCVAL